MEICEQKPFALLVVDTG